MQTLTLNHLDLRTSALALAEAARTRTRDERAENGLSRGLARTLEAAYPVAVARGEVVVELPGETIALLGACLRRAAAGPRWYGSRAYVNPTTFRALAARLES